MFGITWPPPAPEPYKGKYEGAGVDKPRSPIPDLDTQFEDLLDQVWDSEERERLNDRVDLAVRLEELKAKKRRGKK